jgi:hypothetical protein
MIRSLIRRARRALASLSSQGILASTRACCAACARDEICTLYDAQPDFLGAATFHAADLVHARRHGALSIAFASGAGEDEEDAEVGRLVIAALRSEGLEVAWDGTAEGRIEVRLPREEVPHATR